MSPSSTDPEGIANAEKARAADRLRHARLAKARADDPSIWWRRGLENDDKGRCAHVRTHVLRGDGSWAVVVTYRSGEVETVAEGTK